MLEKKVIVIQPTQPLYENDNGIPIYKRILKVCAYARVSTDSDDQLHSIEAQKSYYTKKIQEDKNWEFVGLYADEGLTGTSMRKRPQFMKMIKDAKQGKIDLILTKSVSRFARNTVETLSTIQQLREANVDVFFEKENIYTSKNGVDFMLSLLSSIAQEESRNISENVTWGIRKNFQNGKIRLNAKRFLGYDRDENGKIIINQDEAKTVKMIYNMYLAGCSLKGICDFLTENERKNGRGVVFWVPATVSAILTNEKYTGDALLQKTVTVDYLTQKQVKNKGHAPQYYIKNNHEGIISHATFDLVQELKKKRSHKRRQSNYSNKYPLSGFVFCGKCGKVMSRTYYNYGRANERVALTCRKNNSKHDCKGKPIDHNTLKSAVVQSIHELNISKNSIVDETMIIVHNSLSSGNVEKDIVKIKNQITQAEKNIKEIININVNEISKNGDFYKELYNEKKTQLLELKAKLKMKQTELVNHHEQKERIKEMKLFIKGQTDLTKNTLMGIYKFIIAIDQSNALLFIDNEPMIRKNIRNEIKDFKKDKPIHSGTVTSHNGKHTINYKVIDLRKN